MFVIEQIYIIKQSVGSSKISVCNCSSKNNIYIDSLCDQINYLREENKMKNSIIQSLLAIVPPEMLMIKVITPLQFLRRWRMTI